MNTFNLWLRLLVPLSVALLSTIPAGAGDDLAQGHVFLLANTTDGVVLTYLNTHTSDNVNVTIPGQHLSPPSVCGERNGRCQMTSVSDGSILVILIPLSDGIQLVSYQFENSSYVVRETWFLQQQIPNCHAVFFSRSNPVHPVFFSYCIRLPTHTLRYSMLTVIIRQLNSSQVDVRPDPFNIGTDAALSNFLTFENRDNMCFSDDRAHTVFLRNNVLVDQNTEDGAYFDDNSISAPSCLTSEPRIQMFERECIMAAYCNDTSVLFGTPESFSPNQVFAFVEETDGQVFFCNSTVYVRFHNNTLSVQRRNGDPLSGALAFGDQHVLLGDCLVSSDEQFYFVALLSNSSVVLVDFNNLTTHILADSEREALNLGSLQYAVQGDLLIVSNGLQTFIYNWSRVAVCTDDVITFNGAFDLVIAFVDRTVTKESGCVADPIPVPTMTIVMTTATMTTVTMSTTTTTTIPAAGPGTIPATSGVLATSTVTNLPTTTMASNLTAGGLSVSAIVGISFAVPCVILLVIFAILLAAIVYTCRLRLKGRTHGEQRGTSDSNPNGEVLFALEEKGKEAEEEEEEKDTTKTHDVDITKENIKPDVGGDKVVDEPSEPSMLDEIQLNIINNVERIDSRVPPAEVTSPDEFRNQRESNQFPVTTEPQVEKSTERSPRNDSAMVLGQSTSTPISTQTGRLFSSSIPQNTNSQEIPEHLPLPVNGANHDPQTLHCLHNNTNAEVTTQAERDTESGPNAYDLVTPSKQCPIRPNAASVNSHMNEIEGLAHNFRPDTLNLPNNDVTMNI